jgi:gluconokinase
MSGTAVVVMGVSGCGKSTVGKACADALGWDFVDGDDFHSDASIAKMRAGEPLTDSDRAEWLQRLASLLAETCANGRRLFLPCSALRRAYREQLRSACPGLRFVFLSLSQDDSLARVSQRHGHFFAPALVASQFATLESPALEDGVLTVDAMLPVATITGQVGAWLDRA